MIYHIVGNFRGGKLSRFGGNNIFAEKTFTDCSLVSPPKDATPPNFAEKAFVNSYKTSKFSPLKVSCYTVHVAKRNNICSIKLNKTIMTHSTTIASDSRSIGECRSEVFFTSPPNTKKGRSGYGRSVEMHNFKVLSQLSWLLHILQMTIHTL